MQVPTHNGTQEPSEARKMLAGGMASIAKRNGFGRTIREFPPVVEVDQTEYQLVREEYREARSRGRQQRQAERQSAHRGEIRTMVAEVLRELQTQRSEPVTAPKRMLQSRPVVAATQPPAAVARRLVGALILCRQSGTSPERIAEVESVRDGFLLGSQLGGRSRRLFKVAWPTISSPSSNYRIIRLADEETISWPGLTVHGWLAGSEDRR